MSTLKRLRRNVPKVSRKQLIKKLDSVFSQYIRLKDAFEEDGILLAKCVTCGTVKHWKKLQNGHYYSRGRYPTRWDEDNCHVQCARCNIFLKGRYIEYTLFMIDTYGRDFVDELGIKSINPAKISSIDLKGKIEEYKEKVRNISD